MYEALLVKFSHFAFSVEFAKLKLTQTTEKLRRRSLNFVYSTKKAEVVCGTPPHVKAYDEVCWEKTEQWLPINEAVNKIIPMVD